MAKWHSLIFLFVAFVGVLLTSSAPVDDELDAANGTTVNPNDNSSTTVEPTTIEPDTNGTTTTHSTPDTNGTTTTHSTPSTNGSTTTHSTPSTNGSTTTTSPTSTIKPSSVTTTAPQTTTKPSGSSSQRFDAASFIGGIVLCGGLIAIIYFGCKFYRARNDRNYHQF